MRFREQWLLFATIYPIYKLFTFMTSLFKTEREGDPKITCYQVNQSNFLIEKWVSDFLKIGGLKYLGFWTKFSKPQCPQMNTWDKISGILEPYPSPVWVWQFLLDFYPTLEFQKSVSPARNEAHWYYNSEQVVVPWTRGKVFYQNLLADPGRRTPTNLPKKTTPYLPILQIWTPRLKVSRNRKQ